MTYIHRMVNTHHESLSAKTVPSDAVKVDMRNR